MASSTYVGGLGVRFESTCNGKAYVSLDYHQPTSHLPNKSHWKLTRLEEFDLFDAADAYMIRDSEGYCGFMGPRMGALGMQGERIALFPTPAPSVGYWHGFPYRVNPGRRPSTDLVNQLVKAGVLSFVIGEKLKRGKV